ncbi:AaceriABR110Wp [[Ashbya] aceris (nom. inval.)]|nr:AaceriABR110Wp [[Ashbya] aceris (nom. inval.)]
MKSNVFVGVKGHGVLEGAAYREKYDYVLEGVTNGRYREAVRAAAAAGVPVSPPELAEVGGGPGGGAGRLGLAAPWLELESAEPAIGEVSLRVLEHEYEYARAEGVKQLIVAPPRELGRLNLYAQRLGRLLARAGRGPPLVSVSLPLFEAGDPLSTWELWSTVRRLCRYHPSLTATLAVPRGRTPGHVLRRWLAEPVSCLLVSSSIFATNQYNYPVLHKHNQELIGLFQRLNGRAESVLGELTIVLHGMEKHAGRVRGGEPIYLEYINYLLKKGDRQLLQAPGEDGVPRVMQPLQPHAVDLSSEVYQIFEQDKTKYDLYAKAITAALRTIRSTMDKMWLHDDLNIVVAGAGRGGLVDRTYACLKQLGISRFKLVALEKNPQAVIHLQKKNIEKWANSVDIVSANMREWSSKVKFDLCISELLGSFGCNELAPECLEAFEKANCTDRTIFIPQSYTSYVAPVSAPLLYQMLRNREDNALESPWIVRNVPSCLLSSKVYELWSFKHPSGATPTARSTVTNMKIKHKGEVHGLLGFFTAEIYGDIRLSILPEDCKVKLRGSQPDSENIRRSLDVDAKIGHTPDMSSWSPIFFPLLYPMFLGDDTELELTMLRNRDTMGVWYEWSLSSYVYNAISHERKPGSFLKGTQQLLHKKSEPILKEPFTRSKKNDGLNKAMLDLQNTTTILNAGDMGEPQEDQYEPHVEENSASTELLKRTFVGKSEFLSPELTGWQSVHDVHELGQPMTEKPNNGDYNHSEYEDKDYSNYEEYHVRVRTNTTELHNIGGHTYMIKL